MTREPFTGPLSWRHMRTARLCFYFFAALQFSIALFAFQQTVPSFLLGNPARVFRAINDHQLLLGIPAIGCVVCALLAYITTAESWRLTTGSLTHFGVFRSKKIPLEEITQLRWWPLNRMIIVDSNSRRIPLFLDAMSSEIRLAVIERLQTVVPIENQIGWPRFCQKTALPLQRRVQSPQSERHTLTTTEALAYWDAWIDSTTGATFDGNVNKPSA